MKSLQARIQALEKREGTHQARTICCDNCNPPHWIDSRDGQMHTGDLPELGDDDTVIRYIGNVCLCEF